MSNEVDFGGEEFDIEIEQDLALDKAREVKELFKQKYWSASPELYNGIGIGTDDDTGEYIIKVYFLKETDLDDFPKNIDGVNIKYSITGKIVAQKI